MNPKIAHFRAQWARFPGFSLLFDNPARNLRATDAGACLAFEPGQDPRERLFTGVAEWAARRLDSEAFWRLGVCATPPGSYHVTAWDGLNTAVLAQCDSLARSQLAPVLEALPAQVEAENWFHAQLAPVISDLQALLPIRFSARGLRSTPGIGLVVDLQAADAESEQRLQAFQECRREHAQHLALRWGVAYVKPLAAHLTIAYYANPPHLPEADRLIEAQLPDWEAELLAELGQQSIEFQSLGNYVFSSMAHFYPRSPQS